MDTTVETTTRQKPQWFAWLATRLAELKPFGYMLTGMALIINALMFSGMAYTYLEQSGAHEMAPTVVFWVTLLTGTIWGAVLIWKGCGPTRKDDTQ